MKAGGLNFEAVLAQNGFFRGLAAPGRQALARICTLKVLRKRGVLFREGDQGRSMFLLLDGRVQLYKTAPDGRMTVIRMIKPGEIFAEVVLFERDTYPVTAAAVAAARLLAIPRQEIHALLERTEFRFDFIAMLMEKQRFLAGRIQQMDQGDAGERFLQFLRQQYGPRETIALDMPKKDIAAAIGITPETLSRLLLKLQRRKVLTVRGRTLKILRRPSD